jgi:uncharacterized protein YdhG (YjbR/CyaY superfamily)
MMENLVKNIDEYIERFPQEVQELLIQLRNTIRQAAPECVEKISYAMPAFAQNGNLVYFAAYKQHIGFYPTASAIAAFKNELSIYKNAKGSVQFPINQPLPLKLITDMVVFRVNENMAKRATKKV